MRPELDGSKPLHVTVRLRDNVPGLRNREALDAFRFFFKKTQDFGFRVNHFALLKNHLHIIAEVDNTKALQRGMMSLNGRLGRWLRKRGKIVSRRYPRGLFMGRYHIRVIESSRQMKNTLRYVLLNASKHFRKCPYIDVYSSGSGFKRWGLLLKEEFRGLILDQFLSLESLNGRKFQLEEGLAPPRTWLGRVGWQSG